MDDPLPAVTFHGGAETVTGSKHLVRTGRQHVLLDCGLFQGLKPLRERNWLALPFDPSDVDGVVLSHGHIDHSGALPLLFKQGFRGPIYCTPGTADLLNVLVPDAAYLQEEQAAHADRHDLIRWMEGFERRPKRIYLVHGERTASEALQATLREDGWHAEIAGDGASVPI
jgi:Cft2 family RNA processing exonuclease